MPATAAGHPVAQSPHHAPHRVAVVGAGMVGLATAWFLQERGVEVTVLDREGVAAGASWGNAGWLTPGLATPLPEPAVLKYGVRAVLSPSSPVYVPPSASPRLLKFLTRFARNSTAGRWKTAMGSLVPINRQALESFDLLREGRRRAPRRTRPSRSWPPTGPRPSGACCSRRSSTSTPPARASSSTSLTGDEAAGHRAVAVRRDRRGDPAARPAVHQPRRLRARAGRLGHRPRRQDRHRPRFRGQGHRRRGQRRPRRDRRRR